MGRPVVSLVSQLVDILLGHAMHRHHVLAHSVTCAQPFTADRTLGLVAVFLHVLSEGALVAVSGSTDRALRVRRVTCKQEGTTMMTEFWEEPNVAGS